MSWQGLYKTWPCSLILKVNIHFWSKVSNPAFDWVTSSMQGCRKIFNIRWGGRCEARRLGHAYGGAFGHQLHLRNPNFTLNEGQRWKKSTVTLYFTSKHIWDTLDHFLLPPLHKGLKLLRQGVWGPHQAPRQQGALDWILGNSSCPVFSF